MKSDEIQTNEIRIKAPGFDRRDRTVRGLADENVCAGEALSVEVDVDSLPFPGIGRRLTKQIVAFSGELIWCCGLV